MGATEELIRKEIAAKRDFASKAEALCAVVQKFNGKVFNKRLETAMREIYPVRVEQEFSWKSISITGYIQDRMVYGEPDSNGYRGALYIKNDKIYCGTIRDAFDDDKRIIADVICERIRKTAQYEEDTALVLENQLGRIDEIKAECKRLRDACDRFNHEVAYQIREYYGLKV